MYEIKLLFNHSNIFQAYYGYEMELYPLSAFNKCSIRNLLRNTDSCHRPQIIQMDTIVCLARRQMAVMNVSRITDKDQPRLVGQTEYVVPLFFFT